jgi:mannose-6-phosphate isomerase-like protein (cupin superfamily)
MIYNRRHTGSDGIEVARMSIRRVVVGERDGRSVVLREDVAPKGPMAEQVFLWRTEGPPVVPNEGEISDEDQAFPASGGVWVMRWEVPAGVTLDEGDGDGPVSFEGDRPGYHKTDSVDVDLILSGSIVLELDDEEVALQTGDVVVVNGNDHAWRNDGDETAVILSLITGASRLPM